MRYATSIISLGIASFLAVLAAAFAHDAAFANHMWVLAIVLVTAVVLLLRQVDFQPAAPADPSAYMDGPIRYGVIATVLWAVVVIALQLAYPIMNIEAWFNFGRLRPLHTCGVIFAFCGYALICTSFSRRRVRVYSAAISLGSFFWATSSSS